MPVVVLIKLLCFVRGDQHVASTAADAAPAPTMTVANVDMNRDGTPDVLEQPQVGFAAPVQYGVGRVQRARHCDVCCTCASD